MEILVEKLKQIGEKYSASPAQIAIAWAIFKGTLPIIGVTKVSQIEEAAKSINIKLSDDEIKCLELLGDEAGVNTLRDWENNMI